MCARAGRCAARAGCAFGAAIRVTRALAEEERQWDLCHLNATLVEDYPGYAFDAWYPSWLEWSSLRTELGFLLSNYDDDFFRQLKVRRHFQWILLWYGSVPPTSVWRFKCPLGVLALRLFTLMVSNDADRCIQVRDGRLGIELINMPFVKVVESGWWVIFNMLGRLTEENKRVSFPLRNACEALGETADAVAYRDLLVRALAAKTTLPQMPLGLLGAQPCVLERAALWFSFAAAARDANQSPEVERRLNIGQKLLQAWVPLRHDLSDLVTTGWPVWRLLERIANPFASFATEVVPPRLNAEVIFCGRGWPGARELLAQFVGAQGWRLHFLVADAAGCPDFFAFIADTSFRDVSTAATSSIAVVVVLSPLLWGWDVGSERALVSAVEQVSSDERMQAVGVPTLDKSRLWTLNTRQMVRRPWRLEYKAYPTGYRNALGDRCFETESSSGSIVFQSVELWRQAVLPHRSLFGKTVPVQASAMEGFGFEWLVERDLRLHASKVRVFTCMTPPLLENNYLDIVRLSADLSHRHSLESVVYAPSNKQQLCLKTYVASFVPSSTSGSSASSLSALGTPPLCLEAEAQLALRFAALWWEASGAGRSLWVHASHPVSASMLVTRGALVLPRLWSSGGGSLVLWACCDDAADECDIFNSTGEISGLPPELVSYVGGSQAAFVLSIFSARSEIMLLELHACRELDDRIRGFPLALPGALAVVSAPLGESIDVNVMVGHAPLRPRKSTGRLSLRLLLCGASLAIEEKVQHFADAHELVLQTPATIERTSGFAPQDCEAFLGRAIAEVTDADDAPVAVLSPLLRDWDEVSTQSLLEGAMILQAPDSGADVLSFSTLQADGSFIWHARRIRHRYWRLRYESAGDAEAHAVTVLSRETSLQYVCTRAIAGSGTRIYRSVALLRRILGDVIPHDSGNMDESNTGRDPDGLYNWLVDLDLDALALRLRGFVCAIWPLPEDDYVSAFVHSHRFGMRWQVELTEMLGKETVLCLPGSNWFQVARKGLVAPWCFRRDVTRAFRDVYAWWTSLDPERNFVVPEEGTFLSLFRNGAAGMLPWDSDFDAKLYTESVMSVGQFMNLTKEYPFRSLEIEAYDYKGCGQDSYVLLRRPNVTHHIGDIYVRGEQKLEDHPWVADLFGTRVRLNLAHMEHIFFVRYKTPVRKLFGSDGIPLRCYHPAHNACLPECSNDDHPCEFDDDFVHVDGAPADDWTTLF